MGMYDILGDGHQVKAFPVPCFYASSSDRYDMSLLGPWKLSFMGGLLRGFGKGDKVPLNTWWYRYPDDIMIMDVDWYGVYGDVYHVILDGCYRASYPDVADIPGEAFEKVSAYVTYTGERVGAIRGADDLSDYTAMVHDTYAKHMCAPYQAPVIWNKAHAATRAGDKAELLRLSGELRSAQEADDALEETIFGPIMRKYPLSDPAKDPLCLFGAYLDVMRTCIDRGGKDYRSDCRYYDQLTDEFGRFIEKTGVSLQSFLDWQGEAFADAEIAISLYNKFGV